MKAAYNAYITDAADGTGYKESFDAYKAAVAKDIAREKKDMEAIDARAETAY